MSDIMKEALKMNKTTAKERLYNHLINENAFYNFMDVDTLRYMIENPEDFEVEMDCITNHYTVKSLNYEVFEIVRYEDTDIAQDYFLSNFNKYKI